jgi:hypothetical protein
MVDLGLEATLSDLRVRLRVLLGRRGHRGSGVRGELLVGGVHSGSGFVDDDSSMVNVVNVVGWMDIHRD